MPPTPPPPAPVSAEDEDESPPTAADSLVGLEQAAATAAARSSPAGADMEANEEEEHHPRNKPALRAPAPAAQAPPLLLPSARSHAREGAPRFRDDDEDDSGEADDDVCSLDWPEEGTSQGFPRTWKAVAEEGCNACAAWPPAKEDVGIGGEDGERQQKR